MMRLVGRPGQTGVDNQTYKILNAARQWGPLIRHSLRDFGRAKWERAGWRGLHLRQPFRLREERDGCQYIWWIERDIPPIDLYRCEAYQVVLTLQENGEMKLVFRSGMGDKPIPQPVIASLEIVLKEAANDPARIIPRKMGVAYD